MKHQQFFSQLWQQYLDITPQASAIHQLFVERGEPVINDHVALRTFSESPIALCQLLPELEKLGYRAYGKYRFENKKLDALSFMHCVDENAPRIFLSELKVRELSPEAQAIIEQLISQIPLDAVDDASVFWRGRLWQMPTQTQYESLLQESEYAAWLSVWGLRANHFTVSVNHLRQLQDLQAVNQLLKQQGFALNTAGGEIKGTPAVLLEQSSTLADRIEVCFGDGQKAQVPSCFYEFARRYEESPGQLFHGFIEGNADKIFESTHAR